MWWLLNSLTVNILKPNAFFLVGKYTYFWYIKDLAILQKKKKKKRELLHNIYKFSRFIILSRKTHMGLQRMYTFVHSSLSFSLHHGNITNPPSKNPKLTNKWKASSFFFFLISWEMLDCCVPDGIKIWNLIQDILQESGNSAYLLQYFQ